MSYSKILPISELLLILIPRDISALRPPLPYRVGTSTLHKSNSSI